MFMPYLGAHVFTDHDVEADAGLRLGAMLGGHFSPLFSLSGELNLDVLNPRVGDIDIVSAALSANPLFHVGAEQFDVVFGPKVGFFAISSSNAGASGTISGPLVGMNLGAFFVTRTAGIGALLSYDHRSFSEFCLEEDGRETCFDEDVRGNVNVIGISLAALF